MRCIAGQSGSGVALSNGTPDPEQRREYDSGGNGENPVKRHGR